MRDPEGNEFCCKIPRSTFDSHVSGILDLQSRMADDSGGDETAAS